MLPETLFPSPGEGDLIMTVEDLFNHMEVSQAVTEVMNYTNLRIIKDIQHILENLLTPLHADHVDRPQLKMRILLIVYILGMQLYLFLN